MPWYVRRRILRPDHGTVWQVPCYNSNFLCITKIHEFSLNKMYVQLFIEARVQNSFYIQMYLQMLIGRSKSGRLDEIIQIGTFYVTF